MHCKLENISFTVDKKRILNNVSISINDNDKLLIKGKSGSGKSTLLKIILYFLEPTEGNVFFDNKLLTGKTCHSIRDSIGYIGQKPLHFSGTANEFLHIPFSFKKNKKQVFSKEYCDNLMCEFSLPHDLYNKQYSILSGGEQQRFCIIQSLLIKKEFYILDEITANIDTECSKKIAHYFCNIPKCTVVIVSHSAVWENNAQSILLLDHGLLKGEGV